MSVLRRQTRGFLSCVPTVILVANKAIEELWGVLRGLYIAYVGISDLIVKFQILRACSGGQVVRKRQ